MANCFWLVVSVQNCLYAANWTSSAFFNHVICFLDGQLLLARCVRTKLLVRCKLDLFSILQSCHLLSRWPTASGSLCPYKTACTLQIGPLQHSSIMSFAFSMANCFWLVVSVQNCLYAANWTSSAFFSFLPFSSIPFKSSMTFSTGVAFSALAAAINITNVSIIFIATDIT